MIKRTNYLSKILPLIDKPLIKALIDVRRSGIVRHRKHAAYNKRLFADFFQFCIFLPNENIEKNIEFGKHLYFCCMKRKPCTAAPVTV